MKKLLFCFIVIQLGLSHSTKATIFEPGANVDPNTVPQPMKRLEEKPGSMQYTHEQPIIATHKKEVPQVVAQKIKEPTASQGQLTTREKLRKKIHQKKQRRTKGG